MYSLCKILAHGFASFGITTLIFICFRFVTTAPEDLNASGLMHILGIDALLLLASIATAFLARLDKL